MPRHRAAFSLLPYAGKQALVRFRCATDASVHDEGLYVDDLAPTPRYADVTTEDTGSPDSTAPLLPPPLVPTWLQVRGVDAAGQAAAWSDRVLFDPAVTAVMGGLADAPSATAFVTVAPNPLNPSATVRVTLPRGRSGPYRLDCFDVSGRLVARLAAGNDDGRGTVRSIAWDARDASGRPLASGIYVLRLACVDGAHHAKVALLR